MATWDDLTGWAYRGPQNDYSSASGVAPWLGRGISDIGSSIYGWGKDNPLQALQLGLGAAGTGFGIADMSRAQKEAEARRKLAENYTRSFSSMGPTAFAPNFSPAQLQEMYFRPAAENMAQRGQFQGGAFNRALADAALAAEKDRIGLGNQIYGNRAGTLGTLGYGPPVGPTGSVGALGGALQGIQLMQALSKFPAMDPRNYYLNQARNNPNAAYTGNLPGQYGGVPNQNPGMGPQSELGYANSWNQQLPPVQDYQLQSAGTVPWAQNSGLSLTNPISNWNPSSVMGTQGAGGSPTTFSELYPTSAYE